MANSIYANKETLTSNVEGNLVPSYTLNKHIDVRRFILYNIVKYVYRSDFMAYKKESGIYMITCLANNKIYIGQSKGLRERLYQHKYYLKNNTSHHPLLQEDWNKYNENDFKFEVLEITDNLDEREQFYISKYDSFNNGYNTTTGGIFNNRQDIRQRVIRSGKLKGKNNPMYGIAKGEGNPNAKLKEQQVIDIKTMIKNGYSDKEIRERHNLTGNQYQKIKHNRSWKHIKV